MFCSIQQCGGTELISSCTAVESNGNSFILSLVFNCVNEINMWQTSMLISTFTTVDQADNLSSLLVSWCVSYRPTGNMLTCFRPLPLIQQLCTGPLPLIQQLCTCPLSFIQQLCTCPLPLIQQLCTGPLPLIQQLCTCPLSFIQQLCTCPLSLIQQLCTGPLSLIQQLCTGPLSFIQQLCTGPLPLIQQLCTSPLSLIQQLCTGSSSYCPCQISASKRPSLILCGVRVQIPFKMVWKHWA